MNSFKIELSRLFMISFGVFLFILFFQPFPLEMLDYDSRLLFVTGFGAITFLLACLVFILLPLSIPKWFNINEWESDPPIILSILFMVTMATSYAFYIRYVGLVLLTLYVMFKIVLVCLLPLIILIILYKNRALERIIGILQEQNKYYFSKIGEYEKIGEDEEIDITSNNKSDKLTLKYKNIISIKSADNYTEIYYLENDSVEKKLIRNTLKNIESQLADQRSFIRCHRTRIVNILHIDKPVRSYSGYSLKMNYLEERVPVSRQYLMQVKEAISTNE
ncbi:MAG: LytTR family transcriptional regulator [Bacteroidales bacterium]|nr:LytTR family transcriptional regulator [Bacteroidales bacterium]